MRAAQLTHLAELLEEASDYVRLSNPSWSSRLDGAFEVVLLMAEAEASAEERARLGQLLYDIKAELG